MINTIVKQYLYQQYSDDDNLQAFVTSFNQLAQSYLDWFNQTTFALYTSDAISGVLLDWLATSIYGYPRPSLNSPPVYGPYFGGWGYSVMGAQVMGEISRTVKGGSSLQVTDDYYKRALTWHLYLGDGRQISLDWMKRRIMRFINGVNGSDITVDDLIGVSITFPAKSSLLITIPTSESATIFKTLLLSGYLAIPFQVNFEVTIS